MSGEVECQSHDEFVDRLSDDHFPHVHGEQRGAFGDGFSLKDLVVWSIGCPFEESIRLVTRQCVDRFTYRANAAKVSMIRFTQSN